MQASGKGQAGPQGHFGSGLHRGFRESRRERDEGRLSCQSVEGLQGPKGSFGEGQRGYQAADAASHSNALFQEGLHQQGCCVEDPQQIFGEGRRGSHAFDTKFQTWSSLIQNVAAHEPREQGGVQQPADVKKGCKKKRAASSALGDPAASKAARLSSIESTAAGPSHRSSVLAGTAVPGGTGGSNAAASVHMADVTVGTANANEGIEQGDVRMAGPGCVLRLRRKKRLAQLPCLQDADPDQEMAECQ